jgi:AhpD family alkylhydroperoxidase
MLAVTQVNACRYCSYFHARQALSAGVTPDELNALLAGQAGLECPPEERLALLYAQHWAESDARPDPEAVDKFVAAYGQETAGAIHLVLRMIRMGNLAGNTGDYLLYRLSFGKLGLTETN